VPNGEVILPAGDPELAAAVPEWLTLADKADQAVTFFPFFLFP
jgi:hypothetical protein